MPVLSLPPTFTNSFWSQDYRRGLETLYNKLAQGVSENLEVFSFIKARAVIENDIGNSLLVTGPTNSSKGSGFDADDGASLCMTFRALQSESAKQGQAHKAVAQELATLVADPFGQWATGHATRVDESRKVILDGWLKAYEMATGDVERLKHNYFTKSRRADEAEDDAKFAPGTDIGDKYTLSPKLGPTGVKRTATVSERISQRLKEIRDGSTEKGKPRDPSEEVDVLGPASPVFSASRLESEDEHHDDDVALSPKDKGKGREFTVSPQAMSPPPVAAPLPERLQPLPTISIPKSNSPVPPPPPGPILLAGLPLPAEAVSHLLTRAASELATRKIRFPIIGEYSDCFSGEDFVTWLKENVQGFGGSLDRAEYAARELTERDGLLRRIGELGNRFDNDKDAYYQFRPKAFELHVLPEDESMEQQGGISPVAGNLFRRTNTTIVSIVQKAVGAASPATTDPPHVRARREAEDADKIYRVAVRKLDRQRLGLEEKIEETLQTLQRWELERLRALKTVLLQYQGTLANHPSSVSASLDRSSVIISSYQPENDLVALIERYRTGPFRPQAHLYESVVHDTADVVFGIDLRKWAGEGGWHAVRAKEEHKEHDLVPSIVKSLLAGMNDAYARLPNDAERRKSWIYDVPLPATHHLREAINTLPPDTPIPLELLAKYDAPVIASALKLWILELDPPLGLWEGWEDIRKVYPTVGAVAGSEVPERQRIEDLQVALLKLPKVHLMVLDTLITHFKVLIDTTQVDEPAEIYITKLGLSLGRTILRPKIETEISIQDRHPTLLFVDLVKHYTEIIPTTLERKKRESLERPLITRKRTRMVDQRLSRSRISDGTDPQQLLAAQRAAQHGPPSRATSPTLVSESRDKVLPPLTPPAPPPVPKSESQESQASPGPIDPVPIPQDTYVAPPRPVFVETKATGDEFEFTPGPKVVEATPSADGYQPPHPTSAAAQPSANDYQAPAPLSLMDPGSQPDEETTQVSQQVSQSASSPRVPSPNTTSPSGKSDEERTLVSRSSLSRSGSGEASRVRGPRIARPSITRGSPITTTSSAVPPARSYQTATGGILPMSHTRGASSVSVSLEHANDYTPKKHGGKANAAIFSRRTQASDAEDNILDK